ncbi:MAG TPA: DUF4124 domain-containing protein [Candidatus Binatia bacterium]|nr:DUF4124 domain-containing protein [Candidatus Binatia bacterium]
MSRQGFVALVLGLACLSFWAGRAVAQKVYKWTDKSGQVHFSNVSPGGETAPEETGGGIEAEAQPPPAETTAQAGPEAAPPAAGSSSSAISEEAFSANASVTRMRLKRELAQAKQQSQEIAGRLDALKKENQAASQVGIEMLQRAYGPKENAFAEEESLLKEKQKADKRIEEIRKQYADLHDEAVKRFGHEPGWWLPIE